MSDELFWNIDIETEAKYIQSLKEEFPEGCNVNFVKIIGNFYAQ